MLPLLAALLFASAEPTVPLAPAPAWVAETPLALDAAVPTEDVAGGFHQLLVETQQRAGEGPPTTYHRRAWRVLSAAGVQIGSRVRLRFMPDYEKAVLHHVRVWRAGRDVSSFHPRDVRIVHDEPDLGEELWDERRTAVVFLRDVRPSDVVDYAYTVEGGNPVFGSHFSSAIPMGLGVPAHTVRYRLLWTAARPVFVRTHGAVPKPAEGDVPGGRTYDWVARNTPAISDEDDLPVGFDETPWIQVSDFATWRDVAAWASELFANLEEPGPAVDALVERLRALPREEAIEAAVRFTQDDVRYLGLEIGANSHRPHAPEETARQRFGDCKDKAALLVALLRRLGVEAQAALVSTSRRRALDRMQPSADAFNHAVVRARTGNRVLWIDATRAGQGGGLQALAALPWERALLAEPSTGGLVTIPGEPAAVHTEILEEVYSVASYAAPVRLTVKTTYLGRRADAVRASFDEEPRSEIARRYRDFYAGYDPDLRVVKAPVLVDDRKQGRVVIEEEYELPSFWDGDERELYPWRVAEAPVEVPTGRRKPMAIAHPKHVEHRIVVDLPEALDLPAETRQVSGPTFRVDVLTRREGRRFILEARYDSTSDALQPPAFEAQDDAMEQLEKALSRSVSHAPGIRRVSDTSRSEPVRPPAPAPAAPAPPESNEGIFISLGLLGGVIGTIAIVAARAAQRARRRRQFSVLQFTRPGDSPQTAVSLAAESEVAPWLASRPCPVWCAPGGRRGASRRDLRRTAGGLRRPSVRPLRPGAALVFPAPAGLISEHPTLSGCRWSPCRAQSKAP